MPTYEYRCNECGHRFEAFQAMSDDPLQKCPECSGGVQRLISAGGGVIFKGNDSGSAGSGRDFHPRCGKDHTCCGSETPCDHPPCSE